MDADSPKKIAQTLVSDSKGILAADESFPTIEKRFQEVGIESTEETRRAYRQLLFTTVGIEEFISGVILFDETIRQKTDEGVLFPEYLKQKGIIPGIKIDKGLSDLANFPGEKVTEGVDGLRQRLVEYKDLGAKFTKFRAVFLIGEKTPSKVCIDTNADILARFAAISQEALLTPIVEPEILMDGAHSLEKSEEVHYIVLKKIFEKLSAHKVDFEAMLLKTSFVHPGRDRGEEDDESIADSTLRVLKEVVPPQVPGVVFLSGGDSAENATSHLNAVNKKGEGSFWALSFSFARALQKGALSIWRNQPENLIRAQKEFYKRAKLASLARRGSYEKKLEEI